MESSDDLVKKEQTYMKGLFGKTWDRLLPDSRSCLISAGVLWKKCADIKAEDFDYSGICISATSALEYELRRVFYEGLQDSIAREYGEPDSDDPEKTFQIWPERLLSMTKEEYNREVEVYKQNRKPTEMPKLERKKHFTIGELPFLLGQRDYKMLEPQAELLRKNMDAYLLTIVREKYKDNPRRAFTSGRHGLLSFVDRCENIRKNYRNKAAHADRISKTEAEQCYQDVVGKIEAYEKTMEVTGVILRLYELIR